VFSFACVGILTIGNAASVWPRVSLAAIAIIGTTVIAARLCTTIFSAASTLMIGAFLATFVRPEFVLSFYIFMLITAVIVIQKVMTFRFSSFSFGDFPALINIASLIGLTVIWSFPILHSSARGFVAFGQHVALRLIGEQGLTNPFDNWGQITEQSFPGANSVVSAFIVNPRAFLKFLYLNAIGTVWAVISTYIIPITPWRGLSRIILFVFYSALTYQVLGALTHKTSKIRVVSKIDKMTEYGILIFIAQTVVSCILTYPSSHIVVILTFLMLMSICAMVGRLILDERAFFATVASCIVFVFTPALYTITQPNLEIIRKLRDQQGISTMVEMDGGWCTYMFPQCKTIFAYELPNVLDPKSYFDENRVDAIFVSERLLRYTPVAGNPRFANIIEDPTANGWSVRTLDSENYLLIRKAK
jgi:hypothetical protein